MSKRIVVHVRNGVVESVDVEATDSLETSDPSVVVADHSFKHLSNVRGYIRDSIEVDSDLLELTHAHHYSFDSQEQEDHDE